MTLDEAIADLRRQVEKMHEHDASFERLMGRPSISRDADSVLLRRQAAYAILRELDRSPDQLNRG